MSAPLSINSDTPAPTGADRPPATYGIEQVLRAEREYLEAWRHRTGRAADRPLSGLALSGGGIRSAVYGLGVMQALAKHGLLERFDYLSTVSGGGYIGASLTWCTSRAVGLGFDVSAARLPFGIDDPASVPRAPAPAATILRHLRRHGSYLVPGHGIGWLSGAAIVLRGILLNLGVVWLPAITVVFAAILWLRHRVAGTDARWVLPWLDPLRLGGILLIAFALASIVYSLRSATRSGRVEGRGIPYLARRRFESRTPWLFRPAIVLLVLGSMSPLVALLDTHSWFGNGGLVGGAMTFFGALGGLWSRFVPKGASAARVPAWTGPAGAALVLYGMALLGFWLATQLVPATAAPRPSSVAILLVLPILALAVALCVDLNYTTLHRYYRDRLMEAFLPDFGHGGVPVRPEATAADKARLHEMCDPDAPAAPYHLLNTHVVLTSLDERAGTDAAARERLRLRGGDSFLLSPRSCGSRVTGWCDTSRFMSGSLTLATAMAISGAAVNPNAAAAGVGPQRSTSFAVLMSLLNIRLGFWAPNPRGRRRDPIPNHVHPGLTGCIDRLTPDSDFLELTDGGNFENVGVYELLRRNVRTILVCDAGADPDYPSPTCKTS